MAHDEETESTNQHLMRMRPMTRILILIVTALAGAGMAHGQDSAGCTLDKHVYHCDRAAFRKAWQGATTVAVESVPVNRMVLGQLTETVRKTGKNVAAEGAPAEVTLSLLRRDLTGVTIGPSGVELATLRVYGPGTGSEHGELLWAEIFTGQADMAWPSVVHRVIEQFEESAGGSGKQH
jgi:hypothetical protein